MRNIAEKNYSGAIAIEAMNWDYEIKKTISPVMEEQWSKENSLENIPKNFNSKERVALI